LTLTNEEEHMFNLESAIKEWRRQMLSAGIKAPAPLNELESHLRDAIEHQLRSGRSLPTAFENAVQAIGAANALKHEFNKNRTFLERLSVIHRKPAVEKWMIGIGAIFVAFGVLLGGYAIVMCFQPVGQRVMAFMGIALALLVACRWRYAVPFLPVIANPRKRIAVGFTLVAFGWAAPWLLFTFLLPPLGVTAENPIGTWWPFMLITWWPFLLTVFVCLGLGVMMNQQERDDLGMTRSAP
jgi:hypothetical protein